MKLQFSETLNRFLITCLVAGLSLAILPVPNVAQAAPRIAAPALQAADLTADEQRKLLADTWDIVTRRHVQAASQKRRFDKLRKDAEAKIKKGLSTAEFYKLMDELMIAIGDEHSSFLTPERAGEHELTSDGGYAGMTGFGFDFGVNSRHGYVTQVYPGSPAEQAGLQPHDHILSIGGLAFHARNAEKILKLLDSAIGTEVTFVVRAPGQKSRTVTLTQSRLTATPDVTWKLLEGEKRIGYVYIPSFAEPKVERQLAAALVALMPRDGSTSPLAGLIIDLHGNGGGALASVQAMQGHFTSGAFGTLTGRNGAQDIDRIEPLPVGDSLTVPMAVLINRDTVSGAEIFAGVLQGKKRAKLVGERSAGNIEALLPHDLSDGSVVWVAEETFRLPNGANWEGKGLKPDTRVNAAWESYTAQKDPVLQKAAALLSR